MIILYSILFILFAHNVNCRRWNPTLGNLPGDKTCPASNFGCIYKDLPHSGHTECTRGGSPICQAVGADYCSAFIGFPPRRTCCVISGIKNRKPNPDSRGCPATNRGCIFDDYASNTPCHKGGNDLCKEAGLDYCGAMFNYPGRRVCCKVAQDPSVVTEESTESFQCPSFNRGCVFDSKPGETDCTLGGNRNCTMNGEDYCGAMVDDVRTCCLIMDKKSRGRPIKSSRACPASNRGCIFTDESTNTECTKSGDTDCKDAETDYCGAFYGFPPKRSCCNINKTPTIIIPAPVPVPTSPNPVPVRDPIPVPVPVPVKVPTSVAAYPPISYRRAIPIPLPLGGGPLPTEAYTQNIYSPFQGGPPPPNFRGGPPPNFGGGPPPNFQGGPPPNFQRGPPPSFGGSETEMEAPELPFLSGATSGASRSDSPFPGFGGPPPSGFNGPQSSGFGGPPPSGFGGPQSSGFGGPPPSGFGGPQSSGFGAGFGGAPLSGFGGPQSTGFGKPTPSGFGSPQSTGFGGGPTSSGFSGFPSSGGPSGFPGFGARQFGSRSSGFSGFPGRRLWFAKKAKA